MSGNTVRFRAGLSGRKRKSPEEAQSAKAMLQKPSASRPARQLALAYFIEREIEAGRFQSYADVARRLWVSKARVGQIAGMVLLPTAVQEAILSDEARLNERALRKKAW